MQTLDTDSAVIPLPANREAAPVAEEVQRASYDAVRYNAMQHGILSKLTVLPHEDHSEFTDLLAALIEEHRPGGMTERHLVEELATIIWRKRRVLLAEGARINDGLRVAVTSPKTVLPAAAPFQRGLSGEHADLPDLVTASPEEIAKRQHDADLDLAATREAAAILRRGGATAYKKAVRTLLPGSRDCWEDSLYDEEYPATAEGLAQFIARFLEPFCIQAANEAHHQPSIKAQTLGEGLQVHRLEQLTRYETHLDRKFERTLAMLLKLKDLRSGP